VGSYAGGTFVLGKKHLSTALPVLMVFVGICHDAHVLCEVSKNSEFGREQNKYASSQPGSHQTPGCQPKNFPELHFISRD